MKNKFLQTIVGTFLALLMLFGGTQLVSAQDGEGKERSLVGVWRVRVTPRICVTGVPIPTAAFEALLTFHKGGTLSAWFQNSTITTTRSPSYGLWQREQGGGDYSFKFVHLRYDLATGAYLGSQVARGTLRFSEIGGGSTQIAIGTLPLSERRDEFTTDSQNQVFDVNGHLISTGCANAVGTRFE